MGAVPVRVEVPRLLGITLERQVRPAQHVSVAVQPGDGHDTGVDHRYVDAAAGEAVGPVGVRSYRCADAGQRGWSGQVASGRRRRVGAPRADIVLATVSVLVLVPAVPVPVSVPVSVSVPVLVPAVPVVPVVPVAVIVPVPIVAVPVPALTTAEKVDDLVGRDRPG